MDVRKGSLEDLEVSPRFWRGKRVFLTGHTGFKGSWLSCWLLRLGADLTGYALPPSTRPSLFHDAGLARSMRSLQSDIRDYETLSAAIFEHRPEIVIHLAAQALVHAAYTTPLETYATNTLGTANLLEALRHATGVRAALIVTSDKCYDVGGENTRHAEGDALGGRDPYSASKACAEILTAAYRSSFFLPRFQPASSLALVASARAGNVIGGGDWSSLRLIADAAKAFQAGAVLRLRNPAAIRPWQHVLDPLRGYLLLIERLWNDGAAFASAWNFGPPAEHELSVQELVREFAAAWGGEVRWQAAAGSGFYEAPVLRLNSNRAKEAFSWSARVALPEALRSTAQWYRAYFSGASAAALIGAEIERSEGASVA